MVRFTLLISVSLYLTSVACQSTFPHDVNCVSTFSSDPALFDESRKRITFVFKFDPPHVIRHEKLARAKPRPFPCRERERYYPGLNGAFFDVLNRVAELEDDRAALPVRNALCVYAGDNCTYDGTVRFVDSSYRTGREYKFVTGSYLNYMPNREKMNVVRSAQTYTNDVVLLHRREFNEGTFHGALQRVIAPFKIRGWLVIGGFSVCLCLLFGVFFYWFGVPKDRPSPLPWLIDDVQGVSHQQRVAWLSLTKTVYVLFTIVFLLYELALTFSLFEGPKPLVSSLWQFKDLNVQRLAMVKETANEYIAHAWINEETTYNSSNFPWKRFDAFDGVLRAFRRREIDYLFTAEGTVKYELHRRNLCGSMSVSELNHPPVIGGWYYSMAIPRKERKRIDGILLRMWVRRETLNGLRNYDEAPLDCGAARTFVDFKIIFIQLGIVVLPLMCLALVQMIIAKFSSGRENRNNRR